MPPHHLLYITENSHQISKSDRVIGFFVYDKYKEMVAQIEGVLIEKGTYSARYIVIRQGGFLGIKGKWTLIPREMYEIEDLGKVKTSLSIQSLQDSPSPYDIRNITAVEEAQIRGYFNLEPV